MYTYREPGQTHILPFMISLQHLWDFWEVIEMDLKLSLGTCRRHEQSWDAQEMIAHWEEVGTGLFAWLSLWITDLLMCCILSVSSSHTVTTAKTNLPSSLRQTRIHTHTHRHGTPVQIKTTLPGATHSIQTWNSPHSMVNQALVLQVQQ